MCGIISVFAYHPNAPVLDIAAVAAARDRMTHRGPDAADLWTNDDRRVVLAHRRLAIIDLSPQGVQPLVSVDGRLRIVFNGEIYNYKELRRELSAVGERFRTETDTEVILAAYNRWGRDGLKRLRGMFAFALWDEVRRGMLLARDGFGIKPLYVFHDDSTLVAASEFRALRSYIRTPLTPDVAGQLGFFLRGCFSGDHTPVREIRMLSAGSWLWRDCNGVETGRFFDPVAKALAVENGRAATAMTPGARRSMLADALGDTVAHHLVADVPVGIFLSAGVDSTLIAVLAAARSASDLKSITLGVANFRGTARDEVPEATQLARRLHMTHSVSWLDKTGFTSEADTVIDAMDMPSIDGANTYFVAKAAAQTGLKVALSGVGGDEMFCGYPSIRDVPRMVASTRAFGAAPFLGRAIRALVAPVVGRVTSPKYASVFEYGYSPARAFFLRRAVFMPWELEPALGRPLVDDAMSELRQAYGFDGRYDDIRSNRVRIALMEMELYMRDQLLRDSDWAGMAHSLEIRTPLVDTELFEQLLPLLADGHGVNKQDVGDATGADVLQAVQRPKAGFGLPIGEWLMEHYGLKQRRLRDWSLLVFDRWCRNNDIPNAMEAFVQQARLPSSASTPAHADADADARARHRAVGGA